MAVEARLETLRLKGRRQTTRHELKLQVRGIPAAGATSDVLIHNLSSTGLLLETTADLAIGQEVVIDLPETDRASATIVWANGNFFGCELDRPLSSAAVSAAQLRSDPGHKPPQPATDRLARSRGEAAEPFGARLKRLRKEKGISLVELARRMNVSRPTVWSWEAGKSMPRAPKMKALADIIGFATDDGEGPAWRESGDRQDPSSIKPIEENEVLGLTFAIRRAKDCIAKAAGTTPEKITLIIEV